MSKEYLDILNILDLPNDNYFSIVIKFINLIKPEIIVEWKEKINYLFEDQNYELFDMFNDKHKNKMYDYVNKIKKYYLQYKTNEIELIKNQYTQLAKSIVDNLYIIYQLEKLTGFKAVEIDDPKDTDINYELNILSFGKITHDSRPLFIGLKQNNNFIYINASGYAYLSGNYQCLKNGDILHLCDKISQDKMILSLDTISKSKFYVIPYKNFIDEQACSKRDYTLNFDSDNYLYLTNNLTNENIYDKQTIKKIWSEANVLINPIAQAKYNITYDFVPGLIDSMDNLDFMFCIESRDKNVIWLSNKYGKKYIHIGYVSSNGCDYELHDYEDENKILTRYLADDREDININKKSFCKYMKEDEIEPYIYDYYRKTIYNKKN